MELREKIKAKRVLKRLWSNTVLLLVCMSINIILSSICSISTDGNTALALEIMNVIALILSMICGGTILVSIIDLHRAIK